jgi:periplasmic protein TonB
MSDNYVEKNFLYLLAVSLLLHLAVFGALQLIPPEKEKTPAEPTMVDLTELPETPPVPVQLPGPPSPKPVQKRHSERPQRVAREMAPKGTQETEQLRQQPARSAARPRAEARPETPATQAQQPGRAPQVTEAPIRRGEGLFKPQTGGAPPDSSALFPSTGKLARLEESYRKKYEAEVEEGDTKFLNTEDIQFGSFLRRFETAVYGVWHYPQAALLRGIEGVTPVKITFSRGGEIMRVSLLESSGSRILDDEVLRTLKALGPIGSFPKGYAGQEFHLIAFFHYGIGGGRLR